MANKGSKSQINNINPSVANVQKEIEEIIVKEKKLNPFKPKFNFGGKKVKFEFDGISQDCSTIYEITAVTDKLSSAQQDKIANDLLKFLVFEKLSNKEFIKKIIVIDKKVKEQLIFKSSKTWRNKGIELFNVEVEYFKLEKGIWAKLKEAQELQAENNSKKKI